MDRFAEPVTDFFEIEDWQGGEIYRNEPYLVMPNGDLVLDEYETMTEWAHGNMDVIFSWMRENSVSKIAGEE